MLILAAAILALQFTESIEVHVVNVDVVVTDKAGKPVTGLTKDDFEILEDKKPQVITNFSEMRSGAPADAPAESAPAVSRPRTFILFVDNRSMQPTLRRYVTSQLSKFVDNALAAKDQAVVVMWDGKFRILASLTSDRAAIHKAIDSVAETGTPLSATSEFARFQQDCTRLLNLAKSGGTSFKAAYQECIGDAQIETQRLSLVSRLMLNGVDVAMSTVAGVEGRKVLVFAGTELPEQPGQEMYQWTNSQFQPYLRGFDAPTAHASPEFREQQRDALERIAKTANAGGVTLYPISALTQSDVNAIQSGSGIADEGSGFLRSGNTEDAHNLLARTTGGIAAPVSRMDALLETVQRDLGSYYSLGYRPANDRGGDRPIVVRTKNRAYTVRSRQSYAPKTADDRMRERVVANIYAPVRENEWPVQLRASKPERAGRGTYRVPIEIVAPPNVTLIPRDGGKLAGGFTVYLAVGDPEGALSATFKQPNAIEVTEAELLGFRRTPLSFTATLTLREGENLISVGLLDQAGGTTGFARTTVTATAGK